MKSKVIALDFKFGLHWASNYKSWPLVMGQPITIRDDAVVFTSVRRMPKHYSGPYIALYLDALELKNTNIPDYNWPNHNEVSSPLHFRLHAHESISHLSAEHS